MSQTLYPIADYTAGGTLSYAANTRYTYVNDDNSSTELYSTATPFFWFNADAWYFAKLAPAKFVPSTRRTTNSHYIKVQWSSTNTEWYDDANLYFRLYQGSTLIADIKQTLGYDLLASMGNTPTWKYYYLTTDQMNAITNYKDLRAGFHLHVWNFAAFRCQEIRFVCPNGITEGRPFIPTPF